MKQVISRMRPGLIAILCLMTPIIAGAQDKRDQAPLTAAPSHPSDHAGRLAPGDLLVVIVSDLIAPGVQLAKPVRIAADGTVKLHFLSSDLKLSGLTPGAAEEAVVMAYRKAVVVQNAAVYIRRIQVASSAPPPAAVERFDLLRVAVYDLQAPGAEDVRIMRVDGDGNISLPYLFTVKAAGLTEPQIERAISQAYNKSNLIQNGQCSVLRLETAPPGAEHLDLPDAPVNPVPDILKRWFEISSDRPQK